MTIGRPAKRRTSAQKLREARAAAARRNTSWTELDEHDLVARHPFLVSATTDHIYKPYRGTLFETGSPKLISDHMPLYFYVSDDGGLNVLEREAGTWSTRYERQVRREHARR